MMRVRHQGRGMSTTTPRGTNEMQRQVMAALRRELAAQQCYVAATCDSQTIYARLLDGITSVQRAIAMLGQDRMRARWLYRAALLSVAARCVRALIDDPATFAAIEPPATDAPADMSVPLRTREVGR
jgi:hypothetical protein